MRLGDLPRWLKILLAAALVFGLIEVLMEVRGRRVEAIRQQLWELELGMTMHEVQSSLDVEPTRETEDERPPIVVWWFLVPPAIEAVQPQLVFDRASSRLIKIIVDESRRRERSTAEGATMNSNEGTEPSAAPAAMP